MLYRTYGKTNEKISALGFGCMRLPVIGNDPTAIDEEKAIPMLRYAVEAGVNYLDTAYPYHGKGFTSGGASELFVGKALQDGLRKKVNLATKLPSWLVQTRADMDRYLNEQLERLHTGVIEFYLVHNVNMNVWPVLKEAGIAEFLDQAIRDGRIKYAGFSFHDEIRLFKEVVDYYDWSFCQIQYNYLDEESQAGTEGLWYAAQKKLGVAVMEPLRGGNLVSLPDAARNIINQADVKRTPAEWALKWIWNQPEVSVVLSGMTTMDQVVENIRIAREARAGSLTQKEVKIIEQIKNIFKARIKVGCTGCSYCLPCPSGINIPACFSTYNDHWIFDATPSAKQVYDIWAKLASPASRCSECGECESHCPQHIAIRQELKKVKELFE